MPVAADDTRHFESAVDLSEEDLKGNLDYFREQGLTAEYEGEGAEFNTEKPKDETPKADDAPPKDQSQPADEPKTGESPKEDKPTEDDDDAEDEEAEEAAGTEGEAVTNDGDKPGKPGWRAKKTQQIRELKEKLAAQSGANEELRRQLAAREKTPAATAADSLSPPAAASEPLKPKEFDKPKPVRPKFEDFASKDDPIAAHQDAGLAYTEALQDWKDEKKAFDAGEQQAVQAKQAVSEQEREAQEKVDAIKVVHPDFDAVTNNKFNPVLSYVLRNAAKNGLEIGYQLGKPENADLLAKLRESSTHKESDSQRVIERKIAEATFDVAEVALELKQRAASADKAKNGKPPAPKAPKAQAQPADEQTPPPSAAPPKEKKPAATPRREEATPQPVRSRGAAAKTIDDIPLGDYDARRKFRELNGEL
jgi:hypothetical protein